MIAPQELRLGNTVWLKKDGRIKAMPLTPEMMQLLLSGKTSDFFPIPLKEEWLLQMGFAENKDYPLRPATREFRRVLPVKGKAHHEIVAYIKTTGDSVGWALLDKQTASNQVTYLHQVQNLYFALTGEEISSS